MLAFVLAARPFQTVGAVALLLPQVGQPLKQKTKKRHCYRRLLLQRQGERQPLPWG
jgi:hypothetical protein